MDPLTDWGLKLDMHKASHVATPGLPSHHQWGQKTWPHSRI